MTPVQDLTDEQFQEYALSLLERELGLDSLVRFLRLYRPGTGDYTAERHNWLAGITVADIARGLNSEGRPKPFQQDHPHRHQEHPRRRSTMGVKLLDLEPEDKEAAAVILPKRRRCSQKRERFCSKLDTMDILRALAEKGKCSQVANLTN